jgi:hypothetical protein
MEVIFVYMELLSGHEKIITKSGISLNAGTLNRAFTVHSTSTIFSVMRYIWREMRCHEAYVETRTML